MIAVVKVVATEKVAVVVVVGARASAYLQAFLFVGTGGMRAEAWLFKTFFWQVSGYFNMFALAYRG